MNGQRQKPYRLGRRQGEQGPGPLSWNQDRIEKLATGTTNRTINQAITTSYAITAPKLSISTIRNQLQAQTTTTTAHSHVSNKLKLTKRIFTVGTWNVRTLWATATPFNLTIINVYAPTSEASMDDIETFYDNLEEAVANTPKKDILIITGDWNAKVGDNNTGWESVMGKYGYGTINERGEQLLEFATSHNLFICNTEFQQKPN
ncbi:unnamed protein product, partial [Rotaria sp. Silwood1]